MTSSESMVRDLTADELNAVFGANRGRSEAAELEALRAFNDRLVAINAENLRSGRGGIFPGFSTGLPTPPRTPAEEAELQQAFAEQNRRIAEFQRRDGF